MAALRRSREIDQSTQRFLILTNQAVFVTLSVVKIPRLAQPSLFLTPNHADVIGDQSDAVTQNAWFCCALCAAISGEISISIQTRAESCGRFPVPRICRWESIDGADFVKFAPSEKPPN